MFISEVKDSAAAREFIQLPRKLYRDDNNWICPLDNDVNAVFNPEKNTFFTHGSLCRWLLKNDKGETIGRVAAFINERKAFAGDLPTGGMGFFECIHDQTAAFLLFDTAREWLQAKGMKAMEGPVNFGENDKYWGLLVEGFKPPGMGMNYNPPYYQSFFEAYGFTKKYDQFTNLLDLSVPFPERFLKIANWVLKKPEYTFRHFSKNEFDRYAASFCEIYNDAWSDFPAFSPMDLQTVSDNFRLMKPVMDEKIIWFAFHQDEPIAFLICMPDVNQYLRYLNGKLNWLGKLKFIWYKNTITVDRIRTIVMGCKKKYQNKGIESALIRNLQLEVMPRNTIKGVELAWVGDFNTKMLAIHEATGAMRDKVHRTYQFTFSSQT